MSNISNNIEAKTKTLSEVFSDKRYRIDSFQRDYRWQHKQIDALISDLYMSFMNNDPYGKQLEDVESFDSYYMGPIVLCEDKGELSIVDGQQRLTSFTLLMIYLKYLQGRESLNEDVCVDFDRYIYVRRGGKKTFVLNIPSRNEVMRLLYKNSEYDEHENLAYDASSSDQESNNNLIRVYEDIYQIFPDDLKKEEILPLFIEWFLYKVVMVEIRAFSVDNAYTIFETMNDRGLSLNPTEILKAVILSKITDEEKNEEMNEHWQSLISKIKYSAGSEGDLLFFRAWFRAKYADTIRQGIAGESKFDYEMIGSQFHTWFKNNLKKIHLVKSDDYYNFVKADFDFFSKVFIYIENEQHNESPEGDNSIFITGCYPMADSLYLALMLSPIMASDSQDDVKSKLTLVNSFVDKYLNLRTLDGKSVTQSTIRNKMFDITKSIRNLGVKGLICKLEEELNTLKSSNNDEKVPMYRGFSQTYAQYFQARINYLYNPEKDFSSLLRSRRQKSMVLCYLFSEDEWDKLDIGHNKYSCYSLVNTFLCRRDQVKNLDGDPLKRLSWVLSEGLIPELEQEKNKEITMNNFCDIRHMKLTLCAEKIWPSQITYNMDSL